MIFKMAGHSNEEVLRYLFGEGESFAMLTYLW